MFQRLLILLLALGVAAHSQTVTSLTGVYRNGQVFLTWTNIGNTSALYKVYRSTTKITSSGQLATSEYLGYTNSQSAVDHNLSDHDGTTKYLHTDSGAAVLSSTTGLFVATTLVNGSYYYAVTTVTNGVENQTITNGTNSLSNSIAETVAKVLPVFQEVRTFGSLPADIYTYFQSSKYASNQPLMLNAGFLAYDFALYRNGSAGNQPLRLYFHGGGSDFLENIVIADTNEMKIQIEDYFPDPTISAGWWGSNPAYDVFNDANNSVNPTTGINVNYSQIRIYNIIDWAIRRLPIDSNRIYLNATSDGSPPAFFYAMTYPERLAAIDVHVGAFNFGFLNDWNSNCSLNTGKKNRKVGDERLGEVPTNLYCNLGLRTYDALNGGWVIHQYPKRNFPFIYSVNGKQDKQTGWTEKTIFYDSLNNNHLGGWFFWDNRDHSGNNGKTWGDNNFNMYRYRRDRSYPAFAFCSFNEDWGNGNGNNGADHGTLNGPLDFNCNNIVDQTTTWQVKVFVHNLLDQNKAIVTYPDSGTADVTPRRLQHFTINPGSTLTWQAVHNGHILQSGSFVFQGGLIVIPKVKIFRDTTTLTLTSTASQYYYQDNDGDGYGNPTVSTQSTSKPAGYVGENTDCNDQNGAVHPYASEVCNGVDDNCNGAIDENGMTVSISASGTTTVCSPSTVTLNSTITGTPSYYQWNKDGVAIAGATAASYSATASGNYTLTVSNYFCSVVSSSISATVTSGITATVTPSGTVTECKGTKITLTANTGTGYAYQWLKAGAIISGETKSTYTSGKNENGTFSVIVTSGACSATSLATTINRLDQPNATITPIGNLDICNTGSVMLQANSGSGYAYQWQKGTNNISGATNQNYVATQTGTFKVIVTNSSNCSKTSSGVKVTSSCREGDGLDEVKSGISIQPNPSNGRFEINFKNFPEGENGEVEIFDLVGKKTYSETVTIDNSFFSKKIILNDDFKSGIYFLDFVIDGRKFVQIITIEN